MKHYIDVTLLPNEEIDLYFLWEKVYQQVHLALVEAQNIKHPSKVGVSFPGYDKKRLHLGNKLRLFSSSKEELEAVNINKWFSRLNDYVHITSIKNIPKKIEGYACFKRVKPSGGSNVRLAKRKAKRENISYKKSFTYYESRKDKHSRLPFVYINSQSSGERYPLLIDCLILEKEQQGVFSTYGLSSQSTVPIF